MSTTTRTATALHLAAAALAPDQYMDGSFGRLPGLHTFPTAENLVELYAWDGGAECVLWERLENGVGAGVGKVFTLDLQTKTPTVAKAALCGILAGVQATPEALTAAGFVFGF